MATGLDGFVLVYLKTNIFIHNVVKQYMGVFTYMCVHGVCVCVCVCSCLLLCVLVYSCVCCVCGCMYFYMHACLHAHAYTGAYLCACMRLCVCMCAHTNAHPHTCVSSHMRENLCKCVRSCVHVSMVCVCFVHTVRFKKDATICKNCTLLLCHFLIRDAGALQHTFMVCL